MESHKILLTGGTGYIGSQLAPLLAKEGEELYLLVRNPDRLHLDPLTASSVHVIKGDLLDPSSLSSLPLECDIAYYLVHGMKDQPKRFAKIEEEAAQNFVVWANQSRLKQIIYLSGLVRQEESSLSPHLASRLHVEELLKKARVPVTILRSGIVVGSGSASFEIMRELVEKLPWMVAPRWTMSQCTPIAIEDLLFYLLGVRGMKAAYDQTFEIGGPDCLSYKEMLLILAQLRGLHRSILTLPLLTPRLSSYWLKFITTTHYSIAHALVESLRQDCLLQDETIHSLLPRRCLSYREAVHRCFTLVQQNPLLEGRVNLNRLCALDPHLFPLIQPPQAGTLQTHVLKSFPSQEIPRVQKNIWSIGGKRGWYAMNWAWLIRGKVDDLLGGVGMAKRRHHPTELAAGEPLDFWRVLLADLPGKRLLLYAEMLLPGEAWLECSILEKEGKALFSQRAIFRPRGLGGRLYWYLLWPLHLLLFHRMARKLIGYGK